MPFVVIAFNVNRLSCNIREWFGQFLATRFGTWLALTILEGLGRLNKERRETLFRRRDNRNRKRKERQEGKSVPQDPSPPPDRQATEKTGNGAFKKENIPEKYGRDDTNGPVHSWSFPQALRPRHSLPTIDEENQGPPPGSVQTKAQTFPMLRSRENGFHRGSR